MKTIKIHFWLGVLLAALASSAIAQDSKIGFVDTQRITKESAPAKTADAKLVQEFSKRQKDLGDLQSTLKSFTEKYERDAPTLTDSQRASRQKEYADQNREFQRKQREFQEDLSGRRNEELQQVFDKANKAIKQVAETEKFDLILQVDGPGVVAYTNGKLDITDKVLKILNGPAK
jgi:outer membrane protein